MALQPLAKGFAQDEPKLIMYFWLYANEYALSP